MKEIKQITVIQQYTETLYRVGSSKIERIEDKSYESESGDVYVCFDMFDKDNKLIRSVINCPVIIDYK